MVLKWVCGDVFHAPKTHAIAHCIAKDLRQNAGFAKVMRLKYGGVDELKQQNLGICDIGVLTRDRVILTLITKVTSHVPPCEEDFTKTLYALEQKCIQLDIKHVSCPFIGTGKDQLPKSFVMEKLKECFENSVITVYVWKKKQGSTNPINSMFGEDVMLAGDSNFLRVLYLPPGTQHGHIISGGKIFDIQRSLAFNLPSIKTIMMAGTNDILQYHINNVGLRQALNEIRVTLRKLFMFIKSKSIELSICTIPPCPLITDKGPISAEFFNELLVKAGNTFEVPILDVYWELAKTNQCVIAHDKVHLNSVGVDIVRNFLKSC